MRKTTMALVTALLGATWTATTLAALAFSVVRLTDSAGCSTEPSVSASGKRIALSSQADLVPGGNADGNFEIYVHDAKKGYTQVTTSTAAGNETPAMSKNGARVAFVSANDLLTGGNADSNLEIFLWDKKKGLRQITTTAGCNSFTPAIGSAGKQLALLSTCDLVAGGNADATQEVFLFDEKKGFTQVTSGDNTITVNTPSLSNNGARVAFQSNGDFVPGGNADGSSEIFLFDKKKGFRQITSGAACDSDSPTVSASGARIALRSTCDLVPGSNPGLAEQVFLFDLKKGFTQVGQAPVSLDSQVIQFPVLSANGKRIAFFSKLDLVGSGNADGNYEVFLFDVKKGLSQVSHTTGAQQGVGAPPALSANGKRVVFETIAELTPDANTDDEGELYIADED